MAKEIEKMVRLVFASHPAEKEFSFTSDGQAFKNPSDAANHGRSLENKSVTKITRAQLDGNIIMTSAPKADALPVGGAKNDFQKKGAKGSSSDMGEEAREELVRKYEMLSGNKAGNMKAETLTQKVAELESAAAQGALKAIEDKKVIEPSKDDAEKVTEGSESGDGAGDDANPKID